jgi:hypothetical protein
MQTHFPTKTGMFSFLMKSGRALPRQWKVAALKQLR